MVGDHRVRFYEDDALLVELVARFLGEGLASGQPLIVIATREHRSAFRQRLEAMGFDTAAACERGRFVLLDARETLADFMAGDMPDWHRFKQRVGGHLNRLVDGRAARARAYGELIDLLWRDGNRLGAIRLEEMWNALAKAHSFSLQCAYTMGPFYREPHRSTLTPDVAPRPTAASLENELRHRQELEEALRQALAEARHAEERKDEFLVTLAHELRSPLAPMLTALQLMKVRGDPSGEKERVVLERQIRHMVQLVDDLLDVSRVAHGKLELHKEPIEIAEVVARAVEMTSPLYEEKQHTLTIQIPKRGLAVEADRTRLAQVFANLLANAAKYTDPGGRVEVVGLRDEDVVAIRIRDSGVGIAPELLPRIFDLFVQADQSRARSGGGLGLGLAIVRTMVQLHGGLVDALSDGAGQGSTFVVRLPAVATPERRAPVTQLRQPPRARAVARARRILVVDDNEDTAEMMATGLRLLGHDASVAGDAVSALELAAVFRPETVVLDLGLPGSMDGYALAARLRQSGQPMRIIAVTGYGREDDRKRSAEEGIDAHLVKPVDFDVLAAAVCAAQGDDAASGPHIAEARSSDPSMNGSRPAS